MSKNLILPDGVELKDLLKCLRHLSWGAAEILIAFSKGEQPPYGFKKGLEVEDGNDGPVSAADLAVNSWIIDGLHSSFPLASWKLLSEENAKNLNIDSDFTSSEWLWILDPLDGTKDFLQGTGEYAVHLALLKNGIPFLGLVLIPEKNELWFGVVGMGAWCEDRQLNKKEVSFSDRKEIKDLILVASRNHRDQRLEELLSSLDIGGANSIGSVGCKVASILRGDADFYVSLSGKSAPKDWDMAAPEVVLKAAGGSFTHADGVDLSYKKSSFKQEGCLIASHGKIHSELCKKAFEKMQLIDPEFLV